MKHIEDLTCCRALFAAWVFAYHLNLQAHYDQFLGPASGLISHGPLGVDGFFILSGMILAYAHPGLTTTLNQARAFCLKRLVRIYPVHLAMILALALMLGTAFVLQVHPRDPDRFSMRELLSHLTLLHAWGASDRWAWNYPSWSISAEWAGYLMFPLLWPLLRRQNGKTLTLVLLLTILGAVGARVLARIYGLSLTYDGGLYRFFPDFIAGICILPLLGCLRWRVSGHLSAAFGGVVAVTGALAGFQVLTIIGLWLGLAGLMQAHQQGRPVVLARIPGMVWLGEISYSYYMSFALVETLQSTVWRRLDIEPSQAKLIYAIGTTAMTLGLATLAWWLVEKPALQVFAAYRRRRAAPPNDVPVARAPERA
jgi:peptidoglycan/LPS O-acetylase OafA/YrhL